MLILILGIDLPKHYYSQATEKMQLWSPNSPLVYKGGAMRHPQSNTWHLKDSLNWLTPDKITATAIDFYW